MRVLLVSAAVAAMLATAPLALAATQQANGTIKALNMTAHTVTLADGTVYQLPAKFTDPGLKVGEKVQISWEMKSGKHEANMVTITK